MNASVCQMVKKKSRLKKRVKSNKIFLVPNFNARNAAINNPASVTPGIAEYHSDNGTSLKIMFNIVPKIETPVIKEILVIIDIAGFILKIIVSMK